MNPDSSSASTWLERLHARRSVREPPFRSSAWLIGPAIVRFRQVWNWMSTEWYVRPLVEQQNAFNAEVVEALRQIEERFTQLEGRIDELELLVRAIGDSAINAE